MQTLTHILYNTGRKIKKAFSPGMSNISTKKTYTLNLQAIDFELIVLSKNLFRQGLLLSFFKQKEIEAG